MLARAAAPNERGSVKYNNCAKSDINKPSRHNTVFQKKRKNSYCESSQKMALERIRYSPACAVQEWFSGQVNPGISFSPKARLK